MLPLAPSATPPARPPLIEHFFCLLQVTIWAILEVDSCPAYLRLRFELLDQMGVGTREMSERAAFRRVCVLWTGAGGRGGGLGQFRAPFSELLVMLSWCMTLDSCGGCYLFPSIYDVLGAPNMLHRPSL